ncbi:MAG: CHAT domain-containing protein, partial [Bacteroidales bacterium]|nr:CHAT domain-containing protein [Bacteroidales bacterium]
MLPDESGEAYGSREISLVDTIKQDPDSLLKRVIARIETAFTYRQADRMDSLSDSIILILGSGEVSEPALLAKGYYYAGASLAHTNKVRNSFDFFRKAIEIFNIYPDDTLKSRIIYFMGYAANITGDHLASDRYFNEALFLKKKIYGENSEELMTAYLSSAIAKINLRDFEGAKSIIDEIIEKTRRNIIRPSPSDLALLYQNRGVALANLSEQRQAILNMLKSLEIHEKYELPVDDDRLNLLNNIATTYYYLKEYDKCIEYFEKGLRYTNDILTVHSRDLAVNYALILGRLGYHERGRQILENLYNRFRKEYGDVSEESAEIALNYADYLRIYRLDMSKFLLIYKRCYNFAETHPWNINFLTRLSLGYSLYLIDQGNYRAAHDTVTIMLCRNSDIEIPEDLFFNPDPGLLHNDKTTLDILKAKYLALEGLYDTEKDFRYLDLAVRTAEIMTTVIENIRFRLGEEESRILLGERFRDTYLTGIAVNRKCYDITSDPAYIDKAFGYMEKGKAASLLTSVRENLGIRYHVPEQLAGLEKETRLRIGYYESRINDIANSPHPDENAYRTFSGLLLDELARKDSVMAVIEKGYPGYYSYKYNNRVLNTDEVLRETGRRSDFVSYVAGDTILYIILLNHNVKVIKAVNIDSIFYNKVRDFRQMLSEPRMEGNIKSSFVGMQETGHYLYNYLIEPVKKYFISDRLIISPDRELVLFPFEALLSSFSSDTSLYYSRLPFLFREYNISYAYTATLLAETGRSGKSLLNRTVVFAPEYRNALNSDSAEVIRYPSGITLLPLRYAMKEAVFVKKITNAKIFTGSSATVDAFRKEVRKHNIIHL